MGLKKLKGSKRDRIDEIMEKGYYKQAIPMLLSQINKNPSDSARRKLAKCQFEECLFFDLFATLNAIKEPKPEDEQLRQRALEQWINQPEKANHERMESLACLVLELLNSGNQLDAARITVLALDNWLQRYRLGQSAPHETPTFQKLVNDSRLDLAVLASQDASATAKLKLSRSWFLRHTASGGSPETLASAEALLLEGKLVWQDPVVYWELTQVRLTKHDWAGAVNAYSSYLLRAKAQPDQAVQTSPVHTLPALTSSDAGCLVEAVLDRVAEQEPCPQCASILFPVLEFAGSVLVGAPNCTDSNPFFAALPDWAAAHLSPALACRWVDYQLSAATGKTDAIERVLKAQVVSNPNDSELFYRLALLNYLQANPSLALVEIEKAIELSPERKDYEKFKKKLERLDHIASRKPSERFALLSEREQSCLALLYHAGNFTDLSLFAAACKLTPTSASEMIQDFVAMKLLLVAEKEEAQIWRSTRLVHVGEVVFRYLEDVVAQMERDKGPRYYFPAPPEETAVQIPQTISIFRTGEERRVFQALSRIFLTEKLQNEFILIANTPVCSLFNEKVLNSVDPKDRIYYFSTSIDFCIARKPDGNPVLAVEVDGKTHWEDGRREDDRWKNWLFQKAGLPMLRISSADNDVFYLTQSIQKCLGDYHLLPEDILRGTSAD